MELVTDDTSAARYEKASAMFKLSIELQTPLEDIRDTAVAKAGWAERRGDIESIFEYELVAHWAQNWIDNRDDALTAGKQVSNTMAAEHGAKQILKDASLAVLEEWRERGYGHRVSHAELQRRRAKPGPTLV